MSCGRLTDRGPAEGAQALETLVGLQGRPRGPHCFLYTHQRSGFSFELGPAPATPGDASDEDSQDGASDGDDSGGDDDDMDRGQELEYNPIQLGTASGVRCR